MGVLFAALAFAALCALNSALGYYFFASGIIWACLVALITGWLYAQAVYLFSMRTAGWKLTSITLRLSMVVSLLLSLGGITGVLNYTPKPGLDPSLDVDALNAAGMTLFLLEGVGMALAYRQRKLRPGRRLDELESSLPLIAESPSQ